MRHHDSSQRTTVSRRVPEPAAGPPRILIPVLALLGAVGCGGGPVEQVTVGARLPEIQVVTLEGQPSSLAAVSRGRPTLVAFWGTWCEICRSEVPGLNALELRSKDQLSVIGASLGEPLAVVRSAAAQLGIEYPVVVATDTVALAEMGIDRVPKLVLLDEGGTVAALADRLDELPRGIADPTAGADRAAP